MFFSGDASTRRRVDLGGRSSKERDRQKLLEQTREERKRRSGLRQQNSAALKIQKCYRGRKAVEVERSKVRGQFHTNYGNHCQKLDRNCFNRQSDFLRQLLFFFNASNSSDFVLLVETCRFLQRFLQSNGDALSLFEGSSHYSKNDVVDSRVQKLALACLKAVHHNRVRLKDQLFASHDSYAPVVILLEAVVTLMDPKLPWACKVVEYLSQRNAFGMLRDIAFTMMLCVRIVELDTRTSSLERVLVIMASHIGEQPCSCSIIDPQLSFSSQILSIPFLWRNFPNLKEVFGTCRLTEHYLHQISLCLHADSSVLPDDKSQKYPGCACLLGNILEVAEFALSQPSCTYNLVLDFTAVSTFLLEALPPLSSSAVEEPTSDEDEMALDEESVGKVLGKDLEQQISSTIDPCLIQQLVNILLRDTSLFNGSYGDGPCKAEVSAIGAVCTFLHVTFNIFPLERLMTGLAYRTDLVRILWSYMKRCHENKQWPSLSEQTTYLSGDAPGWLLPLSVFCPVYKHMLMIVDNEEFYEQEKPLSLADIRCLIVILRQALWQLLWIIPGKSLSSQKSASDLRGQKRLSINFIQHTVSMKTSELLTQLQDWNNRRQFTSISDFCATEAVGDAFTSQAVLENTRAYEILKQAPFLVPFTSRVKIFTSQLAAARQMNGPHTPFTRNRFRIRRDYIFEDAFNQLNVLSEEDLQGMIRVTFVNEFGVEEAGIDGGGIFKDFMENITRAAFDVQYGLFKETTDHLLYPNPGSGLIHERHLQFFNFLGSLLGKAMFEGILVDIPFATFFLSKLKQKHNYLNDLPSLDPELYRHLLFLKHYEGDISELELYFVIVNNEYGEQTEEELLPGGKDIRVTNENVITYIHLIANHRLNFQIRLQSSHFLRGFQKLIQKDWLAMFNEHELQLLISGSLEGLDVEDLRAHTHYAGGYNEDNNVIQMLWEVLKNFSLDYQKKFLKFVTGCSRGPLLGFKYLEPQFCIQRAAAGVALDEDLDRLPTSATCMNLLKLPPYRSKEQLEMKLLYAINAEAGFDLS